VTGDALLAVDVGGTFTDVIKFADGRIDAIKIPTARVNTHTSVLEGARQLGADQCTTFNHASTAGLNALLTRRLPKVGFLTTLGHRDVLDMARSWRPFEALTDAHWRKTFGDSTAPLVPRYLRRGVRERILADGSVLIDLDEAHLRKELDRFRSCSIEGLAICLINGYVNPDHERRIRTVAHDVLGDIPISLSAEVSPLAKEYARATTTVIDVFMKKVYGKYAVDLEAGLSDLGFEGSLNFADSSASLLSSEYAMERPFKLVFAGPAAGAVASAHLGDLLGDRHLLCCDVGGTSSDIAVVVDGAPVLNTVFELEPDLLVNSPSIELASLGAGGGSLVFGTPAGEIRVGPESAGADPGPACYDRGGTQPSMTDAFLLVGLLDPDRFNAGTISLNIDRARRAFEDIDSPLRFEQRVAYAYWLGLNNIAQGLLDVVVRRGIDPRRFSLVAFGAAGPLVLPSILREVQARRVIVPPFPGLFSALGLLSADRVYSDSRTSYLRLDRSHAATIDANYREMEETLREQASSERVTVVRRTFDARLVGQSWDTPFVTVPDGPIDDNSIETMIEKFHQEYERRYGNRFADYAVEAVTYRVDLIVSSDKVAYPTVASAEPVDIAPDRMVALSYIDDANALAGEFERSDLRSGQRVRGPAIIREPTSTTHLVAGQQATVGPLGELIIEMEGA
jgi:N-methylhydantoinase A